jgi:hypothetical protein
MHPYDVKMARSEHLFKLKLGVDYNGDIRLRHTKEGLYGRSDLA